MSHNYYVYILTNRKQGALYIGVTNNLERRISEHKLGEARGFSKRYQVNKLVYYEHFTNITSAIEREKELKKWKRQWKINLFEKNNPDWDDISFEWLKPNSVISSG